MNSGFKTKISDSELIITKKGTIYHLDLAPENIAPTIITVGHPERVKEISKHFDHILFKANHREFVTHTGVLNNKKISVVSTGIGPDNIDIVFNELDALANIDFKSRTINDDKTVLSLIRLGTSGALQADIPLDSIVVSSHGIGLDNLMHYYRFENNKEERDLLNEFSRHTGVASTGRVIPYITESSMSLREYFGAGFYHGITVTCPGFYGPQGRVLRLPLAYPNLVDSLSTFRHNDNRITNFEMETSAIYGLARLMGHKSLSISAIIANRALKTFSKDNEKAVEDMIQRSLEVIVDKIAV